MKIAAIGLAVVFALIGVLYALGAINWLTSPKPHHWSHFVLFEVLAALCLVWMRFQSAKPTTPSLR